MPKKSISKWQLGDFQTPIELARKVVKVLKQNHGVTPNVIIEPTCGKGRFIQASYEGFSQAKILGFEINPRYVEEAKSIFESDSPTDRVKIKEVDFFSADWDKIISDSRGYMLVIGNPPWVTSSELGLHNSQNLPEKSNFQNRRGIEAITGSANFDISEWMLLQYVKWLSKRKGMVALLCKYAVARKVMRQARQSSEQPLFGYIYLIDAKAYFSAAVEACLFVLTTDTGSADCKVYGSLDSPLPSYAIAQRDGDIVRDANKYEKWRHLRGRDPRYIWRSGVKHDCAAIMELEPTKGGYKNGLGETIKCEDNYIYPLLKSSDIGNGLTNSYRKVVLITQRYVGEDTSIIKEVAPDTWNYLIQHREYLSKRKSSIYKNRPAFSIFGIGDYSFRRWKVAISGLYKKLSFSLVEPLDGKAVAFDDTVNFLSFDFREEAEFVYRMITSLPATEFLNSVVFWDEKRPITTELLRKLSIKAVSEELGELPEYQRWGLSQSGSTTGQLELELTHKHLFRDGSL